MKNILKIYVVLLCFIFVNSSLSAKTIPKIINGKPASTTNYPWLANLFIANGADLENGGSCGGTLIDSKWVLTAAHCFLNEVGDQVDLSAGVRTRVTFKLDAAELTTEDDFIDVQGKQVFIHPSYNPDSVTSSNENDFDIALLELELAVELTPIKLFIGETPSNIPTIAAGWGATLTDGTGLSDSLLQVQQITVSENACNEMYDNAITFNMICAGGYTNEDKSDTCQGDSGGPLFVNVSDGALQIGITSFGGGSEVGSACGIPGLPGVYSKISELFDFIQSRIPNVIVKTSLADIQVVPNQYDQSNETVTIPKVYVDDVNYMVTLKHTGNLNFELSTAVINFLDNINAAPSYFNNADGSLILPLVNVSSEFFNVTLRHLGDFKFIVESTDPI